MRFREFKIVIAEGYREAEADFSQVADLDTVKQTISNYKTLVNKNQLQGQERNIDYWRKQGWDLFAQRVSSLQSRPTKSQIKKKQVAGKSIFVEETPQWLIVVPLDKSASCFHGRGTEWCTANPTADHFEQYFYDGNILLIYCLKKETGERFAIAAHKDLTEIELFSGDDNSITKEKFLQLTGLDPIVIRDRAFNVADVSADKSRNEYKENLAKLNSIFWQGGKFSTRTQEVEDLILSTRSPRFSRLYLDKIGNSNYPPEIILSAIRPDESERVYARFFSYQQNPTPALIKSAVRINPAIARYVDNLDPKIQMELVKKDPTYIEYINNPVKEAQMEAISSDPWLVQEIKNLDPAVALQAVKYESGVIRNFYKPSEELQLAAVNDNGKNIQYIENPTPRVLIAAVVENPHTMKYIKHDHVISPGLMKQMVENSPMVIRYIDSPSIELQLLAVEKQAPSIFALLDNITVDRNDIDTDVWNEATHLLDDFDLTELVRKMPPDIAWKIFQSEWSNIIKNYKSSNLKYTSRGLSYTQGVELMKIFLHNTRKQPASQETLKGVDIINNFLDKIR